MNPDDVSNHNLESSNYLKQVLLRLSSSPHLANSISLRSRRLSTKVSVMPLSRISSQAMPSSGVTHALRWTPSLHSCASWSLTVTPRVAVISGLFFKTIRPSQTPIIILVSAGPQTDQTRATFDLDPNAETDGGAQPDLRGDLAETLKVGVMVGTKFLTYDPLPIRSTLASNSLISSLPPTRSLSSPATDACA